MRGPAVAGRRGGVAIRTRISGGSVVIAILISVVAGIVMNSQLERIVREGTIAVLDSDAAPYVAALTNEPEDEFDLPGPGQLVAVVNGSGGVELDTLPDAVRDSVVSLVGASDGVGDGDGDGDEGAEGASTVRSGYVVQSTPVDVSGETWHVVSARSIDLEADVLSQMRALLVGGLTLIVLCVAITAWTLTTVSLAPVNQLRRSAERLSRDTLTVTASSDLLPVGAANDEITGLAVTLNDLIGRLRASAQRERQLVSDASHELRTPLAILQTQMELARREASSVEQLTRDIEAAERSAVRLGRLVTSMLALSSLEAAADEASSTGLELEREVASAVERARFRVGGTGLAIIHQERIDSGGIESYSVRAEDFGRVIDNLVNNAVAALGREGDTDGSVTIIFERMPHAAHLAVADTGPGLTREFEPHALERFSRDDTARASGEGSGLGLPIVAAIVARAHGSMVLENSPGAGLVVRIELPRAR